MINSLTIERFKSIRSLKMDCRRVNLFIGEPNVGKSNILEALGLLSCFGTAGGSLKRFVRFELTQQLFYDSLTDEPVRIAYEGEPHGEICITFEKNQFTFASASSRNQHLARLSYKGEENVGGGLKDAESIRFYRFKMLGKFEGTDASTLTPPDGPNLFSVVYGSRDLRKWASDLYRPYGLSLVMKPHERAFELQKLQDGVATAYPYNMSSDTLQRHLFYYVAMESNKGAVLVFEEPEDHAFPYFTKHLGEMIALGASNQFFIATHNPYLLSAIIEKAPKQDVAVFGTYYRDFETKVKRLDGADLERLLAADPFLGLELLLPDEVSV